MGLILEAKKKVEVKKITYRALALLETVSAQEVIKSGIPILEQLYIDFLNAEDRGGVVRLLSENKLIEKNFWKYFFKRRLLENGITSKFKYKMLLNQSNPTLLKKNIINQKDFRFVCNKICKLVYDYSNKVIDEDNGEVNKIKEQGESLLPNNV